MVQKYVERPVTYAGRKFDLRVYLAVRSVTPLEAFMFTGWRAQLPLPHPHPIISLPLLSSLPYTLCCGHT